MDNFRAALAAVGLVLSTTVAAADAPAYSMTVHWPPGYERSAILNERGQMAGTIWRFHAGQEGPSLRAYLLSGGEYIDLGGLLSPTALNKAGQVTLWGAGEVDFAQPRAYLYQEGGLRELGTLGGPTAMPTGINDAGQIVGYSSPGAGAGARAFVYQDGRMSALDLGAGTASAAFDINQRGQIVGEYVDAAQRKRAFLYDGGEVRDLGTLGGEWASATHISDAGHVVGLAQDARGATHGFIYSGGVMRALPDIDAAPFQALGVDGAGRVIGAGHLWSAGRLQSVAELADTGPHWELSYLYGINEQGQISAHGCRFDATCAILLLTPVPEPAVAPMFLGGLAVLGMTLVSSAARPTRRRIGQRSPAAFAGNAPAPPSCAGAGPDGPALTS